MIAVNVAGLLHEAPGATRELRLRDHYATLGPDLELAGPINGLLRLQRTNRGILVRGTVTAPLRRTCARCLEAYVEEATVSVDGELLKNSQEWLTDAGASLHATTAYIPACATPPEMARTEAPAPSHPQ